MGKPLPEPADPKRFYLDFLPFEQRTVGRAGLRLFNILYWHGALGAYVRDGKKHVVRYDPRNLSRVHLLEADGSYLEIPYRDLSHLPVSLDQVKNGARQLRAQGTSPNDERKLFQAIQKQREIIESSSSKTLKARRKTQELQERKPTHNPSAAQQQPELTLEPETPVDPFPFEIWHE